jgi:Lrp/AsnC family leucine-responsive transcriptional regulator
MLYLYKMTQEIVAIDETDRKILRALQANGRLSMVDLADEVHLSPTACQRRQRRLEETGIIQGYRAVPGLDALGYRLQAFIQVHIDRQSPDTVEAFRKAIARTKEVRSCYAMTGEADFLLHVVVKDLEALRHLSLDVLIGLPGVRQIQSSIVLDQIKHGVTVTLEP